MKFKVKIIVKLKDSIKDIQGKTLHTVLKRNDIDINDTINVGKYFELEINAPCIDCAKNEIDNIAREYLSNPVLEQFKILEILEL